MASPVTFVYRQSNKEKTQTKKAVKSCGLCPFYCANAEDLTRHLVGEHKHGKEKRFQCNWTGCEKTFATPQCRRRHISDFHKKENQWHCNICKNKAGSMRRDNYKRHMLSKHRIVESPRMSSTQQQAMPAASLVEVAVTASARLDQPYPNSQAPAQLDTSINSPLCPSWSAARPSSLDPRQDDGVFIFADADAVPMFNCDFYMTHHPLQPEQLFPPGTGYMPVDPVGNFVRVNLDAQSGPPTWSPIAVNHMAQNQIQEWQNVPVDTILTR